ncbi:MAG TPA: hypothetical protein VJP59_09100 [Gemmatimonadota bacterium]|nr:hypothetical protein [Gemmatimonadota bacterium]
MTARNLAVWSYAILTACSSGMSGAIGGDASRPEPVPDDTSASADSLFRELEERLLESASLRMRYTIAAEGALSASLGGNLDLAEESRVTLDAEGTFDNSPVALHLRSDGREMRGGSEVDTFANDAPQGLREALIIGLTRMGLLHTLARLTAGAPPDHAEGGVREWVQVEDIRDTPKRSGADTNFRVLRFSILVNGERSGEASLWMDRQSGLPVRREQNVDFPTGVMRVVEEYGFLP